MCSTDEKTRENTGSGDTDGVHATVPDASVKGNACLPPTRREETVAGIPPNSCTASGTVRAQRVTVALICIAAVAFGVRCCQSGEASTWWSVGARQEDEGVDIITREPQLQTEAPNRRPWRRRIERATPLSSSSSRKSESLLQGVTQEDDCRRRSRRTRSKPSARTEANQKCEPGGGRKRKSEHEQDRQEERECARAEDQQIGGVKGEVSGFPQKRWRALRALWRRIFRNRPGGRSGEISASGEAEAEARARVMEEFREMVERHPGDLLRRAREVRHELDDGMLIRYLDMGLWSLKAGGAQLTEAIESTLRWREEVGPHLITDKDVFDEARDGKMYVRGHDRDGRPIIFYTPALELSFNTREGLKLLYHTLEKATALLPRGQAQFAVVADCAGFGPSKVPPLEMINTAFSTLQEHYTMRLGYVIIVNASGPITLVWKLISSVLPDRTKDKIVFVTKEQAAQALGRHIDPSALPSTLPGGLDYFRYSNEAYLSA